MELPVLFYSEVPQPIHSLILQCVGIDVFYLLVCCRYGSGFGGRDFHSSKGGGGEGGGYGGGGGYHHYGGGGGVTHHNPSDWWN